MSTIFISHSSKNNEWAKRISDWLGAETRKYQSLFLDFDPEIGIPLGTSWRATLFEKLGLCRAVIVLCSQDYLSSQWCLSELAIAIDRGKHVFPLQLDASPLPSLLMETQGCEMRTIDFSQESDQSWRKLELSLAEHLNWRDKLHWPLSQCPFPGLEPFDDHYAPVFYGRDRSIDAVEARMRSLGRLDSALLLLLGSSGCGKSSLVRAGVIPQLRADPSQNWIVLEPFRPLRNPWLRLQSVVAKAFLDQNGAPGEQALEPPIPTGAEAMEATVLMEQLDRLRLRRNRPEAVVVIVIDQFEELLLQGSSTRPHQPTAEPAEADRFLMMLSDLLRIRNGQVLLLATLRTDFLAALEAHPSHLARQARQDLVEPIRIEAFSQLIHGPLQRMGRTMQPELMASLLADSGNSDTLPLLAFTLRELWKLREQRGTAVSGPNACWWDLTLDDYRTLGGLEGSVRQAADGAWRLEDSEAEEVSAVREAFLNHLVRLSEDDRPTRRRAHWQELPERSLPVLERLVQARLLVAGLEESSHQRTLEVAHEALLRTWPTLVRWLEEGRLELEQRRRIKRLGDDLLPNRGPKLCQQAIKQLAVMAVAGSSEAMAVRQEAGDALAELVRNGELPEHEKTDAVLVLGLIGDAQMLRQLLADDLAEPPVRRRAAEALGALTRQGDIGAQRPMILMELEQHLRTAALNVLVRGEADWRTVDDQLPSLQGAARGLQLAMATDLPLLGNEPGRVVPMLTLTALREGEGLRVRTEVVEPLVWRLPLPRGEQLELVVIPGGDYRIGSPEGEMGRHCYSDKHPRDRCQGVDVEAQRQVRLESFAMARFAITQAQWLAVSQLDSIKQDLDPRPATFEARDLWECHVQPQSLPVESVSWYDCQEWLARLNRWLAEQWPALAGIGVAPRLELPSETRWETSCRAGSDAPFHFGDHLDGTWANFNASTSEGLNRLGEFRERPVTIGQFGLVNRFGLAEMHGQIFEWCSDLWHPDPVAQGWPMEGQGWEEPDPRLDQSSQQNWRQVRGGSWFFGTMEARAALRANCDPKYFFPSVGLRPCCSLPPGFVSHS